MSEKTLTRADLVEAVIKNVGLPRHEAVELVESVLQELSSTLARGEPVKLSSFGSFGIRDKRQRIGRNPKTGQEVPITPRRVLVFRASNIMKKRIDETIKADFAKGKGKTTASAKPKSKINSKAAAKPKTNSATRAKPKPRAKPPRKVAVKKSAKKPTKSSKSTGK